MSRSSTALQTIVALIAAVAAFALAAAFRVSTEVTAAVTALYATLVFFQLKESERQRLYAIEHEQKSRPALQIKDFSRRITPESSRTTHEQVATGLYVTCNLVNIGITSARGCQPILTACARRNADNEWRQLRDWLPLGLFWCLDEYSLQASGRPTEERYLVPKRPYLFDLCNVTTRTPDRLYLRVIVTPSAQATDFPPGEYCFEVTVFSENADAVQAWYRVDWSGGITDAADARQHLMVEQLPRQPW